MLSARIRELTTVAHAELEEELSWLMEEKVEQARVVSLLRQAYCFFLGWEPHIKNFLSRDTILAGRLKLPHIKADLEVLGDSYAGVPHTNIHEWVGNLPEALGSLYVIEGSTLGGALITRSLSKHDWFPPSGLRYFDPYGEARGAMWHRFKQRLDTQPISVYDDTVKSALKTFSHLKDSFAHARTEC